MTPRAGFLVSGTRPPFRGRGKGCEGSTLRRRSAFLCLLRRLARVLEALNAARMQPGRLDLRLAMAPVGMCGSLCCKHPVPGDRAQVSGYKVGKELTTFWKEETVPPMVGVAPRDTFVKGQSCRATE